MSLFRAAAEWPRSPSEWPLPQQYGLALVLMLGALLARWLVDDELGHRVPFLIYFSALLPLALLVRPGPFLMAAVIGLLSAWLLFIPPRMSLAIHDETEGLLLVIFAVALAASVLTSWLSQRGRVQRERIRAELRRSEARLRLLTDAAPALISYVDSNMRFRMNNQAYEEWFGQSADELRGKPMREVLGSAVFEHVRFHAEAALLGKRTQFESELRHRDGSTRFVQGHYVPDIEPDGSISGFYALVIDITERKKAEDEVLRRNEQVEALLNAAPLGIYLIDADFRIRLVNPMAEPVFGQIDGGVIGRDFGEILHMIWPAAYADEVIGIFRETIATGEPYHQREMAETRVDLGLVEFYEWHVARMLLPDGRHGAVCYFRDISDQVHARLTIARSEARYRALFESIDEGFCILQVIFDEAGEAVDYRYLETNPAFVKQTGLRNAVGRTVRELVPEIEPSWARIYGEVALTGRPARFIEQAKSMGRWFDIDAFRVGEPAEKRVAVLFTDITERKQAEASMARELVDQQRLQALSSRLIPADDVRTLYRELIDAAVEFSHANGGTLHSVDQSSGELSLLEVRNVPDSFRDFAARVSPADKSSVTEALRRGRRITVDYLAEVRSAKTSELRAHLEAGIRAAQSTPLVTRSGKLIGVLSTHWDQPWELSGRSQYLLDVLARQAADLVERAQAEEALREADRRKDEFLATLAHELRNPLAGIRMASSVIEGTRDLPAQVTQMTSIIERQTTQLVRLINDLLDVSRISRGKLNLQCDRIDLGTLVRQAIADSFDACKAKGLEISAELPPQPVLIDADPVRMAQVLNNLLQNACQFTPSDGTVRVSVDCDHGEAVLRVKDTGIGMSPIETGRVFEMFMQGDEPRSQRAGGLGIGLFLARTIIDLHGGRIEAQSAGPGMGSEFLIRLPVVEQRTPADESGARSREAPACAEIRSRELRILMADDNEDVLRALSLMLRMKGYDVVTAADGSEALQKARELRPDVALLDIGMPGMDGYEVARRIREYPWGKDLLLVAVTGWGQDRDRRQAHDAGFDLHQTKPVSADTLETLIASRVRRPVPGRENREYV